MTGSAAALLERADRILRDHTDYEQTMRTMNQLKQESVELLSLLESLRAASAGLTALDEVGDPVPRTATARLADDWRAAADDIRATRSLPERFRVKPAVDLERTVREEVSARWSSYVESRLAGLGGLTDLADILAQVGADSHLVSELRSGVADLKKLAGRIPDAAAPRRVTESVERIRAALAILVGGSAEVRRFIDAAADGGAPVAALTSAVRDWMREHGAERSFRIVPGRPAHG